MNAVCPKYMKAETVDVNDGDAIHCNGCDEEYSAADVRAVVDCWAKLLPWIETHPARTAEPGAA